MLDPVSMWASMDCGALSLAGQSERHLSHDALVRRMEARTETHAGSEHFLRGLVIRGPGDKRVQPQTAQISVNGGLHGDRWSEGKASPSNQISMMNVNIAHAIANGQSVALFGDNLFTDLDLSEAALPVGSQLRVGQVQLVVSEEPHVPCDRFKKRFGQAAFLYAAQHPRVRGVYLTVVRGGVIRLGDAVTALSL